MPEENSVREQTWGGFRGREYVQQRCQQATLVTGEHWAKLCNPFAQTTGTICTHCQQAFALKEFAWADTGENLLAYLRRIRRQTPLFWRMWFWWLGSVAGAAVVAVLLYFVGPLIPMKEQLPAAAWAAIGAFFGLFVSPYAVTPWLAPLVIGPDFHKQA